jgi:hypothetical protein
MDTVATKSKSRVEEIQDMLNEVLSNTGTGDSAKALAIKLAEMRKQGLSRPNFNLESPYSRSVHWLKTDNTVND